jgi:hypothetical protein
MKTNGKLPELQASGTDGAVASIAPGGGAGSSGAVKLSVNVTRDIGIRLRRIAFDERVSESSIVEIALTGLFTEMSDAQLGHFLRSQGASLRRPARE